MIRAIRNFLALALLTALAACGGGGDSLSSTPSKFRSYDGPPVTQIVVNKGARRMHLISGQTVLKSYDIELGNQPVGAKRFEGDGKTPEGVYFIDRFNPRSSYHLSVGVSYPNPQDTAFAQSMGFRAGSDIFIHGRGAEGAAAKSASKKDWTAGCIAVEDSEIEEIYAMLTTGVPIIINP
ncbi:MAG: L,D-transpeptidase family protein [Paracoccus sp. (in: a-proteobacteria)]|uniref:L,D-transpeptidase family protein n=1 Tax=Paracoccus sp. TaxID=267 RepID=UPI0026E07F4D|nr:L,D-transpeptidase family protein [Paracoccus sp. (in: a-proteobacteria)]MDO5630803.1 L,D-transpeptidase family protein [Paracoccus sp. (in: a-proteobacteria)]